MLKQYAQKRREEEWDKIRYFALGNERARRTWGVTGAPIQLFQRAPVRSESTTRPSEVHLTELGVCHSIFWVNLTHQKILNRALL